MLWCCEFCRFSAYEKLFLIIFGLHLDLVSAAYMYLSCSALIFTCFTFEAVFIEFAAFHTSAIMALVVPEGFQHIHRVMNTNIDGNRKVPYALTAIKGQ